MHTITAYAHRAIPNLTADLTALLDPARVLHSREDLISYGYDGTAALSGVPAVVVMVNAAEEGAAIVKYAAANRIAIVGRGAGLAKKPFLGKAIGNASFDFMKLLKRTLDPLGILNPEKIFD